MSGCRSGTESGYRMRVDNSESEPLRIEVPRKLAGKRFDKALRELLPEHTGSQLQRLVRRGRIKLDGRKVLRSNFNLRGGEALAVRLEAGRVAEAPALNLLHVEDDFAVVNKPAGMITHPAGEFRGDSVSELAVREFGVLPSVDDDGDRPGIVHRLDRETSGLLVIARTPHALDELRRQFRERLVEKRYLALVYGVPESDTFRVDRALSPVPGNKDRQCLDAAGRPALTEVEVLERFREHALVECHPSTGRRHQLRVHLWSLGHAIVGDKLYRPESSVERIRGVTHQALHAQVLAFDHPGDGSRIAFEAPAPQSLQELWDRVRG
ncbi:MAG: 23S rRNA pseudouridine1911/1915/1917 synthase [Chlamydiales bacterium]|jgi:23S rRNA pseudouridine1911/1915/1917 synthase